MWLRTLLECSNVEGCLLTFSCSMLWPCQFCGRLIDIYHAPPFVLSMQKQSISIGSLLCTRIYVTIILMKFTWLFHLCLSWLHDHNVHYGLRQPIHSSPCTVEASTNSFLETYLRIKFWKFFNSDVLLKLNIYTILLYDAYHICGVERLVRSQPSPMPSSYSNETMPNAEQFMITLSEHQTIQSVLVGVYKARALVLVVLVSNYVVVLFSFDIVTNVLISPCIFLLISYIIWHLPNIFFRKMD